MPSPTNSPKATATRAATGRGLLIAIAAALALWAIAFLALPASFASAARIVLLLRWLVIALFIAFAWRRRSLTVWILVAMLAGTELGHDWPHLALSLRVLGTIFLRLIKVIIAPLLFSTLVGGIAGHADLRSIGRMGIKAIVYFELVTTVALFIGLGAINLSRAGEGVHMPAAGAGAQPLPLAKQTPSDLILHAFPENIAQAVAENQVLQVVVFSIIFGIALAMVPAAKRAPMLAFSESLAEVMFKFTNIVMLFAPIGVGAAIAYTVAQTGLGVMVNVAKLLATLYVALIVFLCGVLLPIALAFRVPLKRFLRAVAEPASIAFGTSSSEAALPRAMEAMEAIGVPRAIVAFVMPTGYSFNLDGSTLYQSLGLVFVAQVAGIHLTFGQQLTMMLTLLLASKGVAGVSRASIVILFAMVQQFNLPVEPVYILFGVDVFMDMARTTINVIGNCLATCVVARWEGQMGTGTSDPVIADAVVS